MVLNFKHAKTILPVIKKKLDGFALAGGTALSMCYLKHRESYDLDFFSTSGDFTKVKIEEIVNEIRERLDLNVRFESEIEGDGLVKMLVYIVEFDERDEYKIDFIDHHFNLQMPLEEYEGVPVLSIEDIYLIKIFTTTGYVKSEDLVGRDMMKGSRQDAKDFYDLYCLSTEHMPVSKFIMSFDNNYKEAVINWHKKYDRDSMKIGLQDVITDKVIDYNIIRQHFEEQVERILEEQIGGV